MTESQRQELMLGGLGGQGVILAGVLLGRAAVLQGMQAAGSNSYGAQARGSSCQAQVVISPDPIDYPHAEAPDLLVAMSQGAYDAYGELVAADGVILLDADLVTPRGLRQEKAARVTTTAVEDLGNKQVANVVWVGVVAGYTDIFQPSYLEQAIAETVPQRFLQLNGEAFARGLQLGRALREESGGRPHP